MHPPPTFTLLYTTIRPQAVEQVLNLWLNRAADKTKINVMVTTDVDNAATIAALTKLQSDIEFNQKHNGYYVGVQQNLPGNCVKGWNMAAEMAKVGGCAGDVLIAIADDFIPPENWDAQLATVAEDGWYLKDHVVHVSDGYNTDIFTLAIVTYARYKRFGYVFYPQYESIYSDTELTFVANGENVVINATHLLFEHMHPDCGKRTRDLVDLNHSSDARYKTGRMLFEYRQSIGFPIDDGPMANTDEVKAADVAVYVQAIKDDFCLNEVCDRLVEEGARFFYFSIPEEYWSGQAASEDEIQDVIKCALRLRGIPGVEVEYCRVNVKTHRKPDSTRIQVETSVRNSALESIRSMGHEHIVVVDGDELWHRGLMKKLLTVVNDIKPQCVYTGMVPTIGLPGYPIEGALDFATIYVGRAGRFSECRATYGTRYEMPGHNIIHFTCTRRTMGEIVEKSRNSGHYDDANYDFEGWIKNILPNVREGMTNAHMYRPYQPWKRVGAWTVSEIAEIPKSLHPYLAIPTNPRMDHEPSPHVSKKFTADGIPKAN
jgi:hypothetical protein